MDTCALRPEPDFDDPHLQPSSAGQADNSEPARHFSTSARSTPTCFVGLTDDPVRQQIEHGRPRDWYAIEFTSETDARKWFQQWLDRPGFVCSHPDSGWRHGYWFIITPETRG